MFYTAVRRLRTQWAPHEVVVYVAGDEEKHRDLAAGQDFVRFVEAENNPLGAKLNAASIAAYQDDVDYLLTLGSDNIVSPVMAEEYLRLMNAGVAYVGLSSLFIVDAVWVRAAKFIAYRSVHRLGEPMGPGKLLRGDLVSHLQGCLWHPYMSKGLDWSMTQQLKLRFDVPPEPVMLGCSRDQFVVDIKTRSNMWSFDHVSRYGTYTDLDFKTVQLALPHEEQQHLYLLALGAT